MSAKIKYIGIDGCKGGWFCVILDGKDNWSYRVAPDARAVGELAGSAASMLIDIPIGLPDAGPDERLCDREARQLLGGRRTSSVFRVPVRHTLTAKSYPEALAINRQATGRGLSKQAWWIMPKIREIDELLNSNIALRGVLRESHPELCFWALNGRQAMQHNKKMTEGRQERLAVLERYFTPCHALYNKASRELLRCQVAHDDIVDAMVCAVMAKNGYGCYQTVPARPPTDGQGLAMEIIYCTATARFS